MENKRGGFTLVEVMTAILLFGMLMLLIFPMRRMMVRVLERTGDTFCEDDLVLEISVEDSSESRVFIRITVSEGARVLYERSGNIFCGSPGQQP